MRASGGGRIHVQRPAVAGSADHFGRVRHRGMIAAMTIVKTTGSVFSSLLQITSENASAWFKHGTTGLWHYTTVRL